jgi:hypothetical protein
MSAPIPYPDHDGCQWPIDESCLGDEWATTSAAIQQRSLALATNTLRRLTGYRVGGCPITVRPCRQGCGSGARWGYPYAGYGWFQPFYGSDGMWRNVCDNCTGDCSCGALCSVTLPGPVGEVYVVKVNGATIPSTDYRVMFGDSLTWTGATTCPWPTCQDLTKADTQPNTFSVQYLNSYPVDGLGAYAAGILAQEYALACGNQNCRFPATVTAITRMGTTYEIPTGAFPNGMTGIREVDAYIALWNPKNLTQNSSVWTPDMPKANH